MRQIQIVVLMCALLTMPGAVLAQTEWVDDPANPVIVSPGDPGAWDDAERKPLAVIKVDGVYHMYYHGQPVGSEWYQDFQIGHAWSTDGIVWTFDPDNPVLEVGESGEWDDESLWGAAAIFDGSQFMLWYCGLHGDFKRAGLATNPDGFGKWTRHPDNPVIDVGPPGTWDSTEVKPGAVIFQNGRYQMWYNGGSAWNGPAAGWDWQIGYAESTDGISWTKLGGPIMGPGSGWESQYVFAPEVLFDGMLYRMWYSGGSTSGHSIGFAVSTDGIEWTRYWDNPVLSQSGIDQFPSVIAADTGSYVMWYQDAVSDTIWRTTSDCCSTVYASLIPAAAYASGAEGSFYETDLDLSNASGGDVEYLFSWLPRGESNKDPLQSELFTLGAGQSVRYSNVLGEVFDLSPDAFGALRIDASSDDLMALARIANTPQEPGAGSFGQAMAAIRPCDCTGRHEKRRLLFGTEHDEMRFNVGCLNASDKAARVSFELYASDGTMLGTDSLILMPWSNDQLNRIFQPYRPVTGYVEYWSDLSTGSVYC
ncbi:MAG: hypothetical protein V2I67_00505, partial [Thermoanaerobaculales bacterium]|nr:hypothetical protein [Thermoanaerobaculales bacterium]